MKTIKKFGLLFILLVLPYLMYNYIAKGENNFVKLAVIGAEGHKIPAFSFTNQDSVTITNADYDDNIYIANFIFTTCPTICKRMTINMRIIQDKLSSIKHKVCLSSICLFNHPLTCLLTNNEFCLSVELSKWH
jgi:protein SCO1/2